jgi:hypothetical protein
VSTSLAVEPSQTFLTTDGRKWFALPQDLSLPIRAKLTPLPLDAIAQNRALFSLRESCKQRVLVRFQCEALVKYKGLLHYKRLRGSTVTLSCPNAQQAELAIQAILRFAQSLDGKWLCE